MKEIIINLLEKELKGKVKKEEFEHLIEIPPSSEMGEFAFPCFPLAKIEKKSPLLIAEELAEKIRKDLTKKSEISNVDAKAGYLNFFLNKKDLTQEVLNKILKEGEDYGKGKEKEKVMIEYETPNTNKPLHVGHLRNAAIGMSVSNILEFLGNKVIRADMFNDRGVHICKSMYALKYLSKKKEPDKKPDHFVGDLYVLFNKKAKENPKLEEEAQEMLRKWEEGDKETLELWKKIDSWATKGIEETDKTFGNKFDICFRESDFYKKAKPIIDKGFKDGVLERDNDGNVIAVLEPEMPNKIVQRKDGTSIYITNDIALVPHKFEKYKIDTSLWVVGNEQNLYFRQLFKIFDKLGYSWVKNCKHLSYGMVLLPEGKMKSREGKVVDADDLIKETKDLAMKELEKRYNLGKIELEDRSLKIALAAIKYLLLRSDIVKDMVFNPNEAISFEGNTGPYLLYSYARANSIVKKVKKKTKDTKIVDLKEQEIYLIKKLGDFPSVVKKAYKDLAPNLIANYIYDLSQAFNEFYHACPVLGSEEEGLRLKLVEAFKIVMKSGLNLLGIQEIEEM